MREDGGWDIDGALQLLRGKIDPYIWEQGQELFFAVQIDPRSGFVEQEQLDFGSQSASYHDPLTLSS